MVVRRYELLHDVGPLWPVFEHNGDLAAEKGSRVVGRRKEIRPRTAGWLEDGCRGGMRWYELLHLVVSLWPVLANERHLQAIKGTGCW